MTDKGIYPVEKEDEQSNDHHCKTCQEVTEPVSLEGGGRIGWFCWECNMFHPGVGVKVSPLSKRNY